MIHATSSFPHPLCKSCLPLALLWSTEQQPDFTRQVTEAASAGNTLWLETRCTLRHFQRQHWSTYFDSLNVRATKDTCLFFAIEKTNVLGSVGWSRWHYRKWHCLSHVFSFSARIWQPWCLRLFSPGGKKKFRTISSEQWKTKKKFILDFPGKIPFLLSYKFLFRKIVQNCTDLLFFNDSSENLFVFHGSQNIFPQKTSIICWTHLVRKNWHNLE